MSINLKGAYTRLRDNSKSAMMAAIEIYNKPNFDYRDECCVILLINAWELILKALLSKNRERIYYPKKRYEEYRTFSLTDSLRKCEPYIPSDIGFAGVKSNLDHLGSYRNNAIHFYNVRGFSSIVYNLAQASIKNYSDLLRISFSIDFAEQVNIVLLPLTVGQMPLDPIRFFTNSAKSPSLPEHVSSFINSVGASIAELEARDADVSRLMVTFAIKFESVKRSKQADLVVAVDERAPEKVVLRRYDPNDMLREIDILEKLPKQVEGIKVNQHTFRGFVFENGIKEKSHLYWRDDSGALTKYSPELVSMIKNASGTELKECRASYSSYLTSKRQKS